MQYKGNISHSQHVYIKHKRNNIKGILFTTT